MLRSQRKFIEAVIEESTTPRRRGPLRRSSGCAASWICLTR